MTFSKDELNRYSRQMILPEIGDAGQEKLKASKVLIVGAGGLGSPVAIYLATAGVGTLGLIDHDQVALSNLHRQVVHPTSNIGKPKVLSAKETLTQLNPNTNVVTYEERFNIDNALAIVNEYDLIIDGTDNFPTRYLVNDACVIAQKPFVYGGVLKFEGQCSLFGLPNGPCYRCFFQEPPSPGEIPSCAEAGVVGTVPGMIGLMQANEAIKYLCEIGRSLSGRLIIVDALSTQFREVKINKDPQCSICGPNSTKELVEHQHICQARGIEMQEITVQELKQLKESSQDFYLIDVREQEEWDIAHIEGAQHKPLSNFVNECDDVPNDQQVIIYCKMGGRSANVIQFLESKGYDNCHNLIGGIEAWADEIEPSMPRY